MPSAASAPEDARSSRASSPPLPSLGAFRMPPQPLAYIRSLESQAATLTKALGLWSREVMRPPMLDLQPANNSAESKKRKTRNSNPDYDEARSANEKESQRDDSTRSAAFLPVHPYYLQTALGYESDVSLSEEDADQLLMPPPSMPIAGRNSRHGQSMPRMLRARVAITFSVLNVRCFARSSLCSTSDHRRPSVADSGPALPAIDAPLQCGPSRRHASSSSSRR